MVGSFIERFQSRSVVRRFRTYLNKRLTNRKHQLIRPIPQHELVKGLENLGVVQGDLICVHTKFSALGYVEGGPATFIEALEKVVGPTGTIMMPTFSMRGSMLSYLDSQEAFHVLTTPSKVGVVTETFRNWPGVKRSLHPTNSVVAKGPFADDLLRGHEQSITPFGTDTPFGRIAPFGGKILMVGTHVHSLLHHVQDIVDFPDLYLDGVRQVGLVNEKGKEMVMETRVMRPRVPYFVMLPGTQGFERDYVLLHDYALIFPEVREAEVSKAGYRIKEHPEIWGRRDNLIAKGIFHAANIGAARVGLLDAAPFLSHLCPEMKRVIDQFRSTYSVEHMQLLSLPYF